MLKGCVFIEKSNPFPCRQRTLFEKSLAKTFVKGNEQNQKKITDFLTSYLVERRLFVKIKARHFCTSPFLSTVVPKGGRRGKRILSRNRRSSSRRRTRVRREGENGDSKQKDRYNQRNSLEFHPYYPLTPIKSKRKGLFKRTRFLFTVVPKGGSPYAIE